MKSKYKKLIITIVLAVIVIFFLFKFINNRTGMFNITYPTMEAAINSNRENRNYDSLEVRMVDEPIYIVGCVKNGATNIETLYHTEKGWQLITGQGILKSPLFAEYNYYITKFKGLTIIKVDSGIKGKLDVRDTIGSEFQTYYTEDPYIDFYDWLLVLEEVPEGYQLIINDKRIDIPATK